MQTAAAGRYNTEGIQKITRKQLIKHYWRYEKQQRISAAANIKTLKEPKGSIRAKFKMSEKCQDSHLRLADEIHHLRLQLSKMAAREADALRRLKEAEESLVMQRQKQEPEKFSVVTLEEENAKLIAKLAQAASEMNMQDRLWQMKFNILETTNKLMLEERERAWEMEKAVLKAEIGRLQKDLDKKISKKRKIFFKRAFM